MGFGEQEIVNWKPISITFLWYLWAIGSFAFVATKTYIWKDFRRDSRYPLWVVLGSVAGAAYFTIQIAGAFFFRSHWFEVTGKTTNFLWVFFAPYRILFPVKDDMQEYSKGQGGSDVRKSVNLITGILFDILLIIALIATVLVDLQLYKMVLLAASVGALFFLPRILKLFGTTFTAFRRKLDRFLIIFLLLPIPLGIIEILFGRMTVVEVFHAYLSILGFFSQMWIIKEGAEYHQ
eukprot:TRINITY_DN1679_c0_g1_i1.p1 TRINITY_DN1679_c0_g1~~TRINITY_DN1679_c0_g1_i1.p1  ORF type:complete len:245 (+),score=10.84 TRINITY_DN1679_c0_g1_i1:33-737(+)